MLPQPFLVGMVRYVRYRHYPAPRKRRSPIAVNRHLVAQPLRLLHHACLSQGAWVTAPFSVQRPVVRSLHTLLASLLQQSGFNASTGGIWTTDALYRETWDKVEQYGNSGFMAVDMECTALHSVASFRGVGLGAVLLVSDELFGGQWRSGYSRPQFRARSRQLLTLLFSLFHQASFL